MPLKRLFILCLVVAVVTTTITSMDNWNLKFISVTKAAVSTFINTLQSNILGLEPTISNDVYIVNNGLLVHKFLNGTLQGSGRPLTIYLHHKGDYISNAILSSQRWEPHLVDQLVAYIKTHPRIQLLDIGCNIGVYTLTEAALGCQVVSVDANPNNTARVVQSLMANNLEGRVAVCLNAISNERKNLAIRLVQDNVGGSHVFETNSTTNSVKTIFMDDLVPLLHKDQEVAIKIDIETKEIDALKRASKFFSQRNVTFVMMEWEYIKVMEDIEFVIGFFLERLFKPFADLRKTNKLKLSQYMSWAGGHVLDQVTGPPMKGYRDR